MDCTPIKIVSFNTYLVAKAFNQNRETHPETRAASIRSFLQDKDLCFLQEVWGSGLVQLTNNSKHSLPPSRTSLFSFFGSSVLSELWNSLYLRVQKTGGLFDMAIPTISCQYRAKHTFSKSRSKSLKGVEATLWNIPQWKDISLLVLNTHLDPWHASNRQIQVREIVEFLRDTLKAIDDQSTDSNKENCHDWSRTAVLVVGDFNIKADSEEYHQIMQEQKVWKDYFRGESQHTYALENSLVSYSKDCGRIDYIFGIDEFGTHRFQSLKCISKSIQLQPNSQEMSDHYPLVVELVPTVQS